MVPVVDEGVNLGVSGQLHHDATRDWGVSALRSRCWNSLSQRRAFYTVKIVYLRWHGVGERHVRGACWTAGQTIQAYSSCCGVVGPWMALKQCAVVCAGMGKVAVASKDELLLLLGSKWVGNLWHARSHSHFQCTPHGEGARAGSIPSRRGYVCYRVG